jgi:hypothetical protein
MLEYPGRWGSKAFEESSIPTQVKQAVSSQLADIPHSRLLLIKQEGRAGDEIAFFAATASAAKPSLYHLNLGGYAELLDLDLKALAAGGQGFAAARVDELLFALCTNGLRDQCCAINGIQALPGLREDFGKTLWQSTHHGGHRFGANLLIMPYGLSLGRMHREDAAQALRAAQRGEVSLDHLRGRSSLNAVAQAAEILLRRAAGYLALKGIELIGMTPMDEDRWELEFQLGDDRMKAFVQRHVSKRMIQTSCVGEKMAPLVKYELLEQQTA